MNLNLQAKKQNTYDAIVVGSGICWLIRSLMSFFLLALFSCESGMHETATITVVNYNGPGSYKLLAEPFMDEVVIASGDIDSSNVIRLSVPTPMTVKFGLDSVRQSIYLEPGFFLDLEYDSSEDRFIFSGEGSLINEALARGSKLFDQFQSEGGFELEPVAFLDKLESLRNAAHSFIQRDFNSMPEAHQILLDKFINHRIYSTRLQYGFHLHNSALIDQIYAYQENSSTAEFEFPEGFRDLKEAAPMDSALFRANMDGYRSMLFDYLLECVHNSVFEVKDWNRPDPLKSHELLISLNFPASIREYLLASNMRHWIASLGITPDVDRMYFDINNRYPRSPYKSSLRHLYEEHQALASGSQAPTILGELPDGTPFSTDQLAGKLIYVDVWATWCAPCVREIPFSIVLQSKFSGNDDIVFLNVSVDENVVSWRNFISQRPDWKGIHIVLNEEQTKSLNHSYKVNGYPKYFIVDHGKVVMAKAPRPSEAQLEDILKQQLGTP